jgi:hypothetical protein
MKVGDLVKYIPTPLEAEINEFGVIIGVDGFWWSVLWSNGETSGYTSDSLEVISESR